MEDDDSSFLIFLFIFLIILILVGVFLWYYFTRSKKVIVVPCPSPNPPAPNPPNPQPIPKPCPLSSSFATGTVDNERAILSCPAGQVISDFQFLTKIVDGGFDSEPINLTRYGLDAMGKNIYVLNPRTLLDSADIEYEFSEGNGSYPTQVVYGSWNCSNNNMPQRPTAKNNQNLPGYRGIR